MHFVCLEDKEGWLYDACRASAEQSSLTLLQEGCHSYCCCCITGPREFYERKVTSNSNNNTNETVTTTRVDY